MIQNIEEMADLCYGLLDSDISDTTLTSPIMVFVMTVNFY
jgi:hypothetical protein